MRRYTLKVQCLQEPVSPADLKPVLEEVLLRTQPPLIYRLGTISQPEGGILLAEVASDAKKDFLETRLKVLESKLPVKIETLGWGWIAGKEPAPASGLAPATFMVGRKLLLLRYILLLCLLSALIVGVVLWGRLDRQGPLTPLTFEWILLAIYTACLFLWNSVPLNFRLIPKQIDCLPDELVVTYQFRKKPIHLKWQDIWGLETRIRVMVITTNQKPVRFFIPYPSNHKSTDALKWDALIQAIAQRADLNNVDAGIGLVSYKRYEAP